MKKLVLSSLLLAAAPSLAAHPVFDLVANRTLAHLQHQGGLLLQAGAPGFAKYVHFSRPTPTWKLRAVEDGRHVALAQTQAVLEVPLTAAQAKGTVVVMRLKAPVKGTVRTIVAKTLGAAIPLAAGWQIVSVPVSGLVEGENKIVLGFAEKGMIGGQKASAAVEWIQIGGAAPADSFAADGRSFAKGDGAAWYLQVPAEGALVTGGCALHVEAKSEKERVAGEVATGGSLDLAKLAGQVARLELTATDACKLDAYLTTAGDLPKVTHEPRPKNVVFWMTDDTRADKYKLWNPKSRVETPVLDAFVKKATLFKTAYVQGNESRVSHASLWTGMYPAQHKFISDKAHLNPEYVTLAEVMKPSGLYTAGFMANGFIDAYWGFGDGWDSLHNAIHEETGLKAEDLVKSAKKFFGERGRSPFFLYLGTIDAHVSWRAHQPWVGKYDPEPYQGPFVKGCSDPQLDQIVAGKLKVNERDRVRIVACYDSDISYNDQQFGELLKLLEANGRSDDTMIVLTADHGEEFWDHGRIGHGQSLRQELIHVPMVIYFPPLFPAGKVVEEGVEIVDLLPTMADALGVKIPTDVQGESLIPLAQGIGAGYPRPAIGSQYELAHAMRLGRWKLWVGGSGDTRFTDAVNDLSEEKDVSAARPLERRFVSDALGVWTAYQGKWRKSRWGVASNHKAQLADDLEK
jgi:arylsulfatase A-like enzyme